MRLLLSVGMKAKDKATATRERRYANYFELGHNPFEFYIDLGQFDPHSEQVRMHTRIVTSPGHAKMIASTLASSVEAFEVENGPIRALSDEDDAMQVVCDSLRKMEN